MTTPAAGVQEAPPSLNVAVDLLVQAVEGVEDLDEFRLGMLQGAKVVGGSARLTGTEERGAQVTSVLLALDDVAAAVQAKRNRDEVP
jgi:hypothetical protein